MSAVDPWTGAEVLVIREWVQGLERVLREERKNLRDGLNR